MSQVQPKEVYIFCVLCMFEINKDNLEQEQVNLML